jgi:hypothetical protein
VGRTGENADRASSEKDSGVNLRQKNPDRRYSQPRPGARHGVPALGSYWGARRRTDRHHFGELEPLTAADQGREPRELECRGKTGGTKVQDGDDTSTRISERYAVSGDQYGVGPLLIFAF